MLKIAWLACAGWVAGASSPSLAHEATANGSSTTPSADYAFPLPKPGSYELPVISRAAGGLVLNEAGRSIDLEQALLGPVTVLTFIYTRCGDVCPVSQMQLRYLQDIAAREPQTADRLQLISMSFDPDYDTPEVLSEYASHWRSTDPSASEWLFVTAPDRQSLLPILATYGQTIGRSQTGVLRHMFRAFLMDGRGRIRNIYSLDFFDPNLVMIDVKTLLREESLDEELSSSH